MIITIKDHVESEKIKELISLIKEWGLDTNYSEGKISTIIGLIGDTSKVDMDKLAAMEIIERVTRVTEPYKKANRKFHNDDTVIKFGDYGFGGNEFSVIAGPCSVESEEQLTEVAMSIKESGATFLRGGAFKPRTSPYAFQGMGKAGLDLLQKAKKATGLPIVTELMSLKDLDLFNDVDIIQIGARNMQNFTMLKELGKCKNTILIKRGLANTIEELLMAAEYVMAGGNNNIILCERGIRTFEKETRNTLDLSAVPVIKRLSHLPIVVDPSHATGHSYLVDSMAKAAVVVGADGLMIEVHNNPQKALCDGSQSLTPMAFDKLMQDIKFLAQFQKKHI